MNRFEVGDRVKLITPSRETGLIKWLGFEQVHTVGEVHEGSTHTPEQMVMLEGHNGILLYSWRFEKVNEV